MNWKLCLSVLAAALLGLVPQNGVSCAGGDDDPKDYFTSFFSREASGVDPSYQPFYYTMVRTFYDEDDSYSMDVPSNGRIVSEWSRYCGNAPEHDVATLLFGYSLPTLEAVRKSLGNAPLPDSIRDRNRAVSYLLQQKDSAGLNYLVFAKQSEQMTATGSEDWEAVERDSVKLSALHDHAAARAVSGSNAFIRNRYAFQACKTAFYAGRYRACIQAYDRFFNSDTQTEVQHLALGYKAGALYHTNQKAAAAYLYSRVFAATPHNRRGNFLGFLWSSNNADSTLRQRYLSQASTPAQKAALLGMFSMYGDAPRVKELRQVYALDRSSTILPLLASREISKLEEAYLVSLLGQNHPAQGPVSADRRAVLAEGKQRAATLAKTLQDFAKDPQLTHRAFYATGSAYLYLLGQQWNESRAQLAIAEGLQPAAAQTDQLKMLRLLIAANEPKSITAQEEAALLPATEWLLTKARTDATYRPFLRDFFGVVLRQRYQSQKDPARATMALAVSDLSFFRDGNNRGWEGSGTSYLHDELNAAETEKLYTLTNAPATPWERFLVQQASLNRNTVIESMGTAYLREGNYRKAIEWLERADSLPPMQGTLYDADWNDVAVNVDPFHDYLNDWQRYDKRLPQPYTKLTFARRMQELHQKAMVSAATEDIAKANYQLANAYYNMSQYGNAWMTVAWGRGGSDWNEGGYKTAWEKDFFEVNRARQHYGEALRWSQDREFKAACYFMMAKCAQKQLVRPSWSSRLSYEELERREAAFQRKFRNNALFPGFVKDYGSTKFYAYTYKRCSYLRDFVKKQQTAPKKK